MLLVLLPLLAPASAKDLHNRVGVGFHQQFGSLTALSARYGLPIGKPTNNLQIEADIGVDATVGMPTRFFGGGRVLYTVVAEDNMNLYGAAGAGFLFDDPDANVRIQPALGAEFFLYGLENLGFSVEWGVSIDVGTLSGVRTVGTAPNAAVHYYF